MLILTAVLIAAFLDGLGSSAAVLQMHYFLGRAAFEVSGRLYGLSSFLENALTERIRRRMVKAYPSLKERKRAENGGIDEKQPFCQRLLFYKLAMLFLSVLFWGYYRNDFLLYQNRDHHEPQQRGIRPFQYCMGSGLCAPHCVSLSLQREK